MNWQTKIIGISILSIIILSSNAKAQVYTFHFWADYDHELRREPQQGFNKFKA